MVKNAKSVGFQPYAERHQLLAKMKSVGVLNGYIKSAMRTKAQSAKKGRGTVRSDDFMKPV
jgi:hypothetical protein